MCLNAWSCTHPHRPLAVEQRRDLDTHFGTQQRTREVPYSTGVRFIACLHRPSKDTTLLVNVLFLGTLVAAEVLAHGEHASVGDFIDCTGMRHGADHAMEAGEHVPRLPRGLAF